MKFKKTISVALAFVLIVIGAFSTSVSAVSAPSITKQPVSVSVKAGDTASFTVSASGSGLTYQWQRSKDSGSTWANCTSTGYNTKTFSFKTTSTYDGWKYRCVVKNSGGSVTSTAVNVSVLGIKTQPKTINVVSGTTASFSVSTSGTGVTYQWQYSTDGKTWTNCKSGGYNKASISFTATPSFSSRYYRCVVKNSAGTVYTSSARVYVLGIKTQPNSVSVKAGETAKFSVVATGNGVSYQWQRSKDDGKTWANCTSTGYNTKTISFKATTTYNGWKYRCVIKGTAGTVYSNAVKLTVLSKPTITSQPKNTSVVFGETATFKVTATGGNLSYQWQYSKNGGSSWVNWSGKTAATLSVKGSETNDGNLYRCVVKNSLGTVTSNSAKLNSSPYGITVIYPDKLCSYDYYGSRRSIVDIVDVVVEIDDSTYIGGPVAIIKLYGECIISEGDYIGFSGFLYNNDIIVDTIPYYITPKPEGASFVETFKVWLYDYEPGYYYLNLEDD